MENAFKPWALKNKNGVVIEFIPKGGRIVSAIIPDKSGKSTDVILGYKNETDTKQGDVYFGAICGRVANRIKRGKFILNGIEYQLSVNDGENTLHGGQDGFWNKVWSVNRISESCCELNLQSPDGDQGFPGNLNVTASYSLNDNNELEIIFSATCDSDTIINLTSHPYFNLMPETETTVFNHQLTLYCSEYCDINNEGIPSGKLINVEGSDFDFREKKSLEHLMHSSYQPSAQVNGVDHSFTFDAHKPGELKLLAEISHPLTNRKVSVLSTQPAVQVYIGSHLDGSTIGKYNIPYDKHSGIALEAQNLPDAIHHSQFPDCVLKKGETYKEIIIYRFEW